jgi:hypothetical protein
MLLVAVITLFPCLASAQIFTSKTQSTTLTVQLNAVSGILLNASGLLPTLTYTTDGDYTNGVTTAVENAALSAFSTSAYSITVGASTNLVNTTNSAITIPVNDVTVTPTLPAANAAITITPKAIPLTSAVLIVSTAGTLLQNFNLQYSTVNSVKADFINVPAGSYQTTITYTITNP